jgi:hypothetical protein
MPIRRFPLLVSLILLSTPAAFGSIKTPKPQEKVKLIFSVDQGFGNGIVFNDDQVAIGRIINALQPLRKRYDAYLLLNPMVRD